MSKKELSNLRNQINKLDEKLFSMIFKRMNIAKKIGEIKVQHNMEITNSDRENELIKHILGLPDNSFCLLYTSPSPRDQRGSGMAASG